MRLRPRLLGGISLIQQMEHDLAIRSSETRQTVGRVIAQAHSHGEKPGGRRAHSLALRSCFLIVLGASIPIGWRPRLRHAVWEAVGG